MPLDVDKYFDNGDALLDVKQDGVDDAELFKALNSDKLSQSYGLRASDALGDYETFSKTLGYSGNEMSDFSALSQNIARRKESKRQAKERFNETGAEKARQSLAESTKNIPVVNFSVRVFNELDRIASLGLSTAAQMVTSATQGLIEQVAVSGAVGTGAPGPVITEPREERLRVAAEMAEALEPIKETLRAELIDPELAESVLGQSVQVAASLGTGFAALAINPVAGATAFESLAFREAVEEYDANAKNPNPEDRLKFGLSVAIPTAALDFAVGGEATLAKMLVRAPQSTRRAIITQMALSVPKEGLTEGMQGEIMKFMANREFDQDREHFNSDFFRDVMIGMIGAGVGAPLISLPSIVSAPTEFALDSENFSPEAFKVMQDTFTEEEFIAGAEENPMATEVLKAARNGDQGAQKAVMQIKDEEVARAEVQAEVEAAPTAVQLSKEGIRESRESRSAFNAIAQLPTTEQVRFRDVFDEAIAKKIDQQSSAIMEDVIKSGRPLTLLEHAGLSAKAVQLTKQHSEFITKGAEAAQAGNEAEAQSQGAKASAVNAELDQLEHFVDRQRSEAGRILGIGRMRQDVEDFSVSANVRAATANKGEALTQQELTQITKLSNKVLDLQSKLDALQGKLRKVVKEGVFGVLSSKDLTAKEKKELTKLIVDTHQAKIDSRESVDSFRKRDAWEKAVDISAAPRALVASADVSAALRQGALLGAGRPDIAVKAFGMSIKAAFDLHQARGMDLYIKSRPSWDISQKAGLHHSSLDRLDKIQKGEETFASNVAEKLPWVRASERHMVTYLNMLRSSAFDVAVRDLQHKGMSEEQMLPFLKKFAKYVNAASGRGTLKAGPIDFEKSAKGLAAAFFAPRWAVSRFEAPVRAAMLTGTPVAKYAARDFGLFVGLGNTILFLASMAGAGVGWDPDDSDFGKIVIGDTRIDFWGGFKPAFQLVYNASRSVGGVAGLVDEPDRDLRDQVGNFFKYKLSPAANIPLELMTGEDAVGNELDFFLPDPEDPFANIWLKNTVPLFLQDITDAALSDTPENVILVAPLSFIGVGATTFEK
jgi:hypothetical protein